MTEATPPKGNFPFIHRYPVTQVLIGPPNYHLYPQLLDDHYTHHVTCLDYETFLKRLEAVKEQNSIDKWVEQMSQVKR